MEKIYSFSVKSAQSSWWRKTSLNNNILFDSTAYVSAANELPQSHLWFWCMHKSALERGKTQNSEAQIVNIYLSYIQLKKEGHSILQTLCKTALLLYLYQFTNYSCIYESHPEEWPMNERPAKMVGQVHSCCATRQWIWPQTTQNKKRNIILMWVVCFFVLWVLQPYCKL